MAYLVSQTSIITGITSASQVTAASLASSFGTTTTALNAAVGTGNSVTTGPCATGGSGISQTFNVAAGSSISFSWDFLTAEDPYLIPGACHNDIGFVSVNGQITALGRLNEQATISTDFSAHQYIPFTVARVFDGLTCGSYIFETGDCNGNEPQRQNDYLSNLTLNGALGFGANRFKTTTITFDTAGAVTLGFGVLNVQTTGSTSLISAPSALLVDNIVYTTTVGGASAPEPGTLALVGVGMLSSSLLRRRTR